MVQEAVFPSRRIDEELVMSQTNCSLEEAIIVLRMHNYDIVGSILYLVHLHDNNLPFST
jgi:NACalpha-BTF3-like transcription factor